MSTLTVGAGQQYTTIATAVAATHDGDTVLVQAGTYLNDFFDVTTKITLKSVGGLAVIDATAQPGNGKGAIVVDNDVTIDGFGVTGVTVGDGNGAGIRYDSGQMTIKNSVFWANQDGLLANGDPNGNILIENSEFSDNGAGDGYTHNIYVNGVASLTIQNSYFHDAQVGHEIKSRALVTTITGSRIQDNTTGSASYDIDLPDGGLATITNNTIEKGPNAQNNFAIHYGGEGGPYAGSSLTISGNTILSDKPGATLLLNQTAITAQLTNNQIYGFSAAQIAQGPVTQSGNTTLTTEPALNLSTLAPAALPAQAVVPPPDLSVGTKLTNFGQAGAVVASGHILTVGTLGEFKSLQSAVTASQDGDTIEVAAGTYVNDFGAVNHKVIIEGVGGMARLVQKADPSQQAGILVINNDVTLENLEITGASSYNGYEAGVLINAGNVTIDNSFIHDNEIGLTAVANPATTLSIYNSEFGNNSNTARGTNGVQVNGINSLTIQGSYFHGSQSGHELVDKAFNTDIENTRIIDGATTTASFLVDLGQGGNAIISNDMLVKGPNSQNSILVHVGGEGATYANSNVVVNNDTLVTQLANVNHPYTYFIAGNSSQALAPITASNDVFVGGVVGSRQLTSATGVNDTTAASATIDTSSPWSAAATPASFVAPSGPDTLTLRLSEDKADIDAQFLVTLDGTAIGGGVITAPHGGAGQVFSFFGTWSAGAHALGVTFLNAQTGSGGGAYDFYVQAATLGGSTTAQNQFVYGGAPTYTTTLTNSTPLPDFDAAYYLAHNPDVAQSGVDPMTHYLTQGFLEGRNPNAWFDTNYYLTCNPDVKASRWNPLLQYEKAGWAQGRDPSLAFSDSKYLAANPDGKSSGIDPLQQYLTTGQAQGRATFLTGVSAPADMLVNAAYYDKQLGATIIPATGADTQAAASYASTGWQKGLNPDQWFDTNYYLSHNPDVAAAHIDPLLHYEEIGWTEHRNPSAAFSTDKYLAAYKDVAAAHVDPLLHFVEIGQSEGRQAFSV